MKGPFILINLLFCLSFLSAQSISEIQGTGAASPYAEQVVTTSGIVTAVDGTGYFLQDGIAVRSGIYVYEQTFVPMLGDEVEITGLVTEFFDLTEIKEVSAMVVLSQNNPLPAPIELSTQDISQEDYESMLVRVTQATCTNSDAGFGEFEVDDGSGFARVDDLFYLYSATEGIDYTITGPLYYSFDFYKIVPRDADDIEIAIPLYFTVAPKETTILTNSLTVTWETNVPSTTSIEYGLTPALELGTITDPMMNTNHQLTIENLDPATVYYVKPYSEAGADVTPVSTKVMATASLSSGKIRAYFNHEVETSVATISEAVFTTAITDTIIGYIDQAQVTLDFTMYEAQNEAIVNALNEAFDRGVIVRVISDDEGDNEVLINNLNPGISVLEGNANGIMHNKFMITDRDEVNNSWVLTGSMNHTLANLGWDYNNVICIQDQSLASAYTLEFEEMWGGTGPQPVAGNAKFGAQKSDNTPHCFNVNGVAVEAYFSPSDGTANRIAKAINAAENKLAFAILVFTENSLGNAVLDAHNRGVEVKGIIDYVEFNGSEFDFLVDNNVNVIDYQNADGTQWPDGPTLHHKYAIVDYEVGSDRPLLITGSHNWTASANAIHDENTLLIYDAEVANWYWQEFYARFFGLLDSTSKPFVSNQLNPQPNPCWYSLQVDCPEEGVLQLFDLNGKRLIAKRVAAGTQQVDVSGLSQGSYVLTFQDGQHIYFEKIIKAK